jgi:hypothetical protein
MSIRPIKKSSKCQALFCQKVKDLSGEYIDEVVESLQKRLVNFSFHAQMLSGRSTKRRIQIEPPEKRRRWDKENI